MALKMKLGLIVNCKIKFMPAYSCYNYVDCETILWHQVFRFFTVIINKRAGWKNVKSVGVSILLVT